MEPPGQGAGLHIEEVWTLVKIHVPHRVNAVYTQFILTADSHLAR